MKDYGAFIYGFSLMTFVIWYICWRLTCDDWYWALWYVIRFYGLAILTCTAIYMMVVGFGMGNHEISIS